MAEVTRILTHPGGAHKDDFLACSLLVHLHQVPVERREPEASDLESPEIAVVDVGDQHDPAKNNYDHHQFAADHPPTCALSLVLKSVDLYDDALKYCDWLEPAEWLDSRGPNETANWLGIDRDIISKTTSPIDVTLLRRFAQSQEIGPDSAIWQIMNMVGEDLITYLRDLRERLEFIARHASFWDASTDRGPFEVLFMPRTDPLPSEPSAGLGRFIESEGKTESVIAMVYPDRRGNGYALSRFNDNRKVNFADLESTCEDVHFAHARGFVCKTSATSEDRLRELLASARMAGEE